MDFWTWAERRALKVVILAFAVIIALQFAFFNGGMDVMTSLLVLLLLIAVSQIRTIERWWKGTN